MTTTAPTSIPPTRYDAFLYAAVREDRDGMPLTVLSFLARLDVDPWEEAAKLAQLPVGAARAGLAALIALLPVGGAARLDAGTVAERLVALLPPRMVPEGKAEGSPTSNGAGLPGAATAAPPPSRRAARLLVGYFVWIALMLAFQWYSGRPEAVRGTEERALGAPLAETSPATLPPPR